MEHLGGVNFHGRPQYDSDGLITSSEVATISGSLQTNIDEKSNNDHIHDDRYYTESEVDTISGTLSAEIDSDIVAHTSNADAHHTESHTIVSHSDTTATGANLNELVGVGDTALHKHDGQYYTESEVDTISGSLQTNINGKPDTEVFLVEGVPSGAIGKENDIAVDQETGDVYEKCSSSNYTTYNPSDKSAQIVLSNGNLTATNSASSDAASVRSVLGKLSGKYYWEVTISESVTEFLKIGIGNSSANIEDFPGKNINSYGHGAGGGKYYNDNWQEYGDSFTEGDTVSIALDMDNGKVWWAKNGVWQASGDPASGTNEAFSGINGTFYSMDSPGFTSGESVTANFGMSSFLYSVPSGFTAGLSLVTEVEWSKKLSPDFLKLSDTPSTYSEAADKYLKTTNSGIEFSDDELYTKSEVDTISGSLQTNIDSKSDTSHIHDDRYYTESEIDDIITTISGKLDDHNELNNLDYASSGHTGFQPAGDYATDSELTSVSGILQINIDGKSDVVHTHDDRYYTESETDTISGSLNTKIDGKADTSHTHDDRYYTETELNNGQLDNRYYTESEVDTISGSLQTNIDGKADTGHIHDDRYYTESEIDDIITTISGKLDDHNELNNLDYASSGHTGFQPAGDYATNSELTSVSGALQINIDGKSAISHIHDDRYYTETELNAGQLDNRYYIESEVDTISGSLQINIDGKADVSHIHDDRYYTESEVDDLITTISGTLGDHSGLNNLDYASSGHTGFQPAGDYLTDSEFSTYSGTLQNNIDSHASNHTDGTDDIQSATNTQKGLATSAQIISIEANTAHKTSTGADHSYIDQTVVSGTAPTFVGTNITEIPSTNLHFNVLGDPTYKTAQDWFDVIQSSGILDGFVLSNSRTATELDVSVGKGIIKETDSELGATVSFETGAVENITLTSDNINYIYVDYNSGTPQIIATTNRGSIELNRHFEIGRVYKNGTTLHILNAGVHISNLARSEHERLVERDGFTYVSGSIVSETGTLNLDVTAGVWFLGHNRLTTDNLNTDTGDDAWIYTHYGAASWITDNATTSGVDCTHYNAETDVLGTLGTNNYSTQWIYITANNDWYIIYGTQNGQLTTAEDASPPTSTPTYIATMGELIAKMIVKEDGTIVDIQSAHDITFTSAGVPNHNETGGIQGGAANEYYHLTSTQHVDLTDGGDSTSHKHDDRYYTESEVDTISGSLNTKIDGKIANLSEDSTPDLGGQLGVGEYDIKLDALLSADGKYSGTTRDGILGDTLSFGDLVYLNTTDQRWELSDADAETTSGDVDLAIVLAAGDDGDTRLLLTDGYVREDDWNFTSYGQALFVSVTAGDMTQTAPVDSGDIVRVVGKAGTTANEIHFKPSETWIELS